MVPIIAGGLAGAGCGSSLSPYVGTWRGARTIPNRDQVPEAIRNTLERITVEVRTDGTFRLEDAGIVSEGDARPDPQRLLLIVKTRLDMPVERTGFGKSETNQPIELRKQPDGSLLFFDPAGFDARPIPLRKIPQ